MCVIKIYISYQQKKKKNIQCKIVKSVLARVATEEHFCIIINRDRQHAAFKTF